MTFENWSTNRQTKTTAMGKMQKEDIENQVAALKKLERRKGIPWDGGVRPSPK
ncbi:MAG: hypothetical protein AB7T38_18275 [Nitrospirales bacterium]